MKKAKNYICENCNGNSFSEKDGYIVCDYCGTKYTPDRYSKLTDRLGGQDLYNKLCAASKTLTDYAKARDSQIAWERVVKKNEAALSNSTMWFIIVLVSLLACEVLAFLLILSTGFFYRSYTLPTVAIIITAVVSVVLIVIPIIVYMINREKQKKYKLQAIENAKQWFEYGQKNYDYQSVAFLPPQYRFPLAVEYMKDVVYSGNARNLSEAIGSFNSMCLY